MSDQSTQAAQDGSAPKTTDNNQGAGTDGGQPPATPPAQPAPPAAAPPPQGDPQNPPWLKDRLERAKQSAKAEVLGELGFKSAEEIAELKAAHDAKLEADKTAEQKAVEAKAEAERLAKENAALSKTIAQRAQAEMAKLTEEQRSAVLAAAGEDGAQQLRMIDTFAPTWAKAAAAGAQQSSDGNTSAAAAATGQAAAPPNTSQQPPATTAAPRTAPTDADTSPVDHKAAYEQLKQENPVKAAHYLNAHGADIYPSA